MNQIVKFRPFPATKVFSNGLLDEFLNRNFSDFVGSDAVMNQPAVNVVETKDNFRVEIAAPGFDKQDFSITTEKEYVTIEAKREVKTENADERYTRREFRFESFKRSYKLPETVNQDLISAVYENGILNVTLPKKEEVKPVAKTIAIG
ncbi:MAG: Hsp20/alpha crystallin family protein [Bacteroidota bacterium]